MRISGAIALTATRAARTTTRNRMVRGMRGGTPDDEVSSLRQATCRPRI
jgi:hypothetical protein